MRDALLDPGSWICWDAAITRPLTDGDYARRLTAAAERSGSDEAVSTGEGRIEGRRIALLINDFDFMAGSIGMAAADRICAAIRRATRERLPLVASTASGGTRMQEGTPAFLRMVDIVQALVEHRADGLLYFVHLRHPTTGGVWASWGSLGHMTFAEPGALIGLIGPKVYEQVEKRAFPAGVQVAENLMSHGVIDAVVPIDGLRRVLSITLNLLAERVQPRPLTRSKQPAILPPSPWEAVQMTREGDSVSLSDLLVCCDAVVRLNGTSGAERVSSVVLALARIRGTSCVLVGQDREAQLSGDALGPAAMKIAHRGMMLAESLALPLITVIDTPGVELSADAENRGLAREIATCLATISALTVPSVAILLGQGGGAGAMALFPAARAIATEHSWLAPLPLEGASAIQYGDTLHAPEMARSQRIGADELQRQGRVHAIVHRPQGQSSHDFAAAILSEVRWHVDQLGDRAAHPEQTNGEAQLRTASSP